MDSLKFLSSSSYPHQRLHASAPKSGHIHKGHSHISAFATIPTKYETYVIENKEKRGFNSSTLRFNYEQDENIFPGVGYYSKDEVVVSENPSYSKRGTGAFASRNPRKSSVKSLLDSPAPNLYDISKQVTRKDFSPGSFSKNFQNKVAQFSVDRNAALPAPNTYHIDSKLGTNSFNNPSSSFISKTTRKTLAPSDNFNKPGPGQYTVSKSDHAVTSDQPTYQAAFKSKATRGFQTPPDYPGPSDYNINLEHIEHKRSKSNHQSHYLCLAAKALPLPPTPPQPGPGQYEVARPIATTPHFMSSSMFLSTANRWSKPSGPATIGIGISSTGPSAGLDPLIPGPAQYQPTTVPKKQSFHYNITNRWM